MPLLTGRQFWTLCVLAVLGAVGTIANMFLYQGNRVVQTEVNSRQQYIQQSVQLEGLYREIVKALADLSVRNQDPELAKLLGAHGITISINAPKPASGPPAAVPGKGDK
jgi:hypothetical protein